MVAALRLLKTLQVFLQGIDGLEGRAVDALQHGTFLVAAPVCAGDVQELASAYLRCRVHVRATAQIHEVPVAIDADDLIWRELVDYLQLEGLVSEHLLRLCQAYLLVHEWKVAGNGLPYALLDGLYVLGGEGAGHLEVVVEAVICGRANAQLGLREQLEDGVRHHMGGGVSHTLAEGMQVVVVV